MPTYTLRSYSLNGKIVDNKAAVLVLAFDDSFTKVTLDLPVNEGQAVCCVMLCTSLIKIKDTLITEVCYQNPMNNFGPDWKIIGWACSKPSVACWREGTTSY